MGILTRVFRHTKNAAEHPLLKVLNDGYGHRLSEQTGQAINAKGEEVPWFTYPAIEFLQQLDLSTKRVFEWGAGNSSVFFCKRAYSVKSVEISEDWFRIVKSKNLSNHQLILRDESNYANAIIESKESYDIIVIDGAFRAACAEIAPSCLTAGGVIIYDNSDRDPENCERLRQKGYIEIDFHGFGPINPYSWTTSIFFVNFNFYPIKRQPVIPVGGGF